LRESHSYFPTTAELALLQGDGGVATNKQIVPILRPRSGFQRHISMPVEQSAYSFTFSSTLASQNPEAEKLI